MVRVLPSGVLISTVLASAVLIIVVLSGCSTLTSGLLKMPKDGVTAQAQIGAENHQEKTSIGAGGYIKKSDESSTDARLEASDGNSVQGTKSTRPQNMSTQGVTANTVKFVNNDVSGYALAALAGATPSSVVVLTLWWLRRKNSRVTKDG